MKTTLTWRKNSWGYVAVDARGIRWLVRGPIMGQPMYWVYRNGARFDVGTPDCPVPNPTAKAAKATCERASRRQPAV